MCHLSHESARPLAESKDWRGTDGWKVVAIVHVVLLSLLFVEIITSHCHPLQHHAEQIGNINYFSFISECFSSSCISSFS